jgi:hypothetical protein
MKIAAPHIQKSVAVHQSPAVVATLDLKPASAGTATATAHSAFTMAATTPVRTSAAPYGFWQGVDGRHGKASPRDTEVDAKTGKPLGELDVAIARRMDPAVHGTSLVAHQAPVFGDILKAANNSIEVEPFYRLLELRVPKDILATFDQSMAASALLAKEGLAPPPPDAMFLRRSLVQAYLHSNDIQTVMSALGFPPGNAGEIVGGLAWVEKAVNFLQHHMPREHFGVRHLPRGEWDNLEHALATDTAINHSEIGKAIARDAATVWQQLELEGKVVPWQKLKRPEGANDANIQRSFETLQSQNALGDKSYAKYDAVLSTLVRPNSDVSATVLTKVQAMRAGLSDPAKLEAVRSGALLEPWKQLNSDVNHKGTANEKKVVQALGEAIAARSAQVSVANESNATKLSAVIAEFETLLGHAEPQYFPVAELLRSIDTMNTLPTVIQQAKDINDLSAATVYGTWVDLWQKEFPFPNVPNGSLNGQVALVSSDDAIDAQTAAKLAILDGAGATVSKLKAAFPDIEPELFLRDYIHVDPNAPANRQIKVNVSALGPFGSAMVIWGDSREDANAIMDPHRLSPHHNGNSDSIEEAPKVAGQHDLLEFAPLSDVQQQMKNKFFPKWFGNITLVMEKLGELLLDDARNANNNEKS